MSGAPGAPGARRRWVAILLLVAAALGAGAILVPWVSEDWLRADLSRAVRRQREVRSAEGYETVIVGEPRTGAARPGERVRIPLLLDAPGELAVAGVCDGGCRSLGLRLLDAAGRPLGADAWGDAVPVVRATVDVAGPLDLEVDMRECHTDRCQWAVQLIRLESLDEPGGEGSTGTCFAVGPDGLLLTANHVVADAREIGVRFVGGRRLAARVERADPALDVALLRVSVETPVYLPLVGAGGVRLGEPVFTVGFPAVDVLGESPKYNDGTVGALEGIEDGPPAFQLSIPVQPGSSGGPVVNDRGEVVGVVEAVADAEFFRDGADLVPQSLSWAVQAGVLAHLVPEVEPPEPAASRAEAVERVLEAVCLVETR